VWWNIEVFIESGPTRIGSGLNSRDGGNSGSGSGKGSSYNIIHWLNEFAEPISYDTVCTFSVAHIIW